VKTAALFFCNQNQKGKSMTVRHPYHSLLRRGMCSLGMIVGVMAFGTVMMHVLEEQKK
jgi:hypothetical protein